MRLAWSLVSSDPRKRDPESKPTGVHVPASTWLETIIASDGEFLASYQYVRCSCGASFVKAQTLRPSTAAAFDAEDEIREWRLHRTNKSGTVSREANRTIVHTLPKTWDWSRVA